MFDKNLYNLTLFQGLDHSRIDQIIPLFETCTFSDNVMVFQQDQAATYFYILVAGEIIVKYKPYDGEELLIARVSPEDIFGWSAALGRSKYTSSAYATVPSIAIRIQVNHIQQFCEKNPQLGMILLERLASGIAYRLRSTHDEVLALLTRGMEFLPEEMRQSNDSGTSQLS
ncbi:MAG TPA: cyclic nucleotide-binding domain-containing protein [Leptolinea sp.]